MLWFRDSETCEDHAHEWFEACARAADPICQALYAAKPPPHLDSRGPDGGAATAHNLEWSLAAANSGLGSAMFKLARASLKALPSLHLPTSPLHLP